MRGEEREREREERERERERVERRVVRKAMKMRTEMKAVEKGEKSLEKLRNGYTFCGKRSEVWKDHGSLPHLLQANLVFGS